MTVKLVFFPELSETEQHIYTYILHQYTILKVLMSPWGVPATDHDPAMLSAQIQIDGSAPVISISFNVRAEAMSRLKWNRSKCVAYMLCYVKHLNFCQRAEQKQFKERWILAGIFWIPTRM